MAVWLAGIRLLACAALALGFNAASAEGLQLSGFGTVAFSRSDSPYAYQRFVDRGGSFRRDSVLAVQGDLQLSQRWSATAQLKLAQLPASEHDLRARLAWGFVAWRPGNDWFLRVGRMRLPLYLASESMDLGTAYDLPRWPEEMYSISPTSDYDGLSLTRSWALGMSDLSADLYAGGYDVPLRIWLPASSPGGPGGRAKYHRVDGSLHGLVLSWRSASGSARLGVLRSRMHAKGGAFAVDYPLVTDPVTGSRYFQVDDALPGPGVRRAQVLTSDVFSAGVEQLLPGDWKVTTELLALRQNGTALPSDHVGGHLSVSRALGSWTPFISWARVRPTASTREVYLRLWGARSPAAGEAPSDLSAALQTAAQGQRVTDQRSLMIGLAYSLGERQKLKLAYEHKRVGITSGLVDGPPGDSGSGRRIRIWTVSHNFHF